MAVLEFHENILKEIIYLKINDSWVSYNFETKQTSLLQSFTKFKKFQIDRVLLGLNDLKHSLKCSFHLNSQKFQFLKSISREKFNFGFQGILGKDLFYFGYFPKGKNENFYGLIRKKSILKIGEFNH